ncbi:MAG: hypothetical protein NUV76_08835 [Candidatus Kuenenia sp.]|nr:hypothetical protein [Candidatus Kuenenia sp.]
MLAVIRTEGLILLNRKALFNNSCWFTENITGSVCLPVAYSSAEYGPHHSLPFYAGGRLNNPVPPLEASGTSGMKAALNGVPTLSILGLTNK